MKKGLLTVLLASPVLVGCQNYDDQFDDLNAQISALKSQVDGLSSLSGQVSSLSGTISGLQSGISAATAAATAAPHLGHTMVHCNPIGHFLRKRDRQYAIAESVVKTKTTPRSPKGGQPAALLLFWGPGRGFFGL